MDYKQQIKSKLAIFFPLSQNYKTWEMNNALKNCVDSVILNMREEKQKQTS